MSLMLPFLRSDIPAYGQPVWHPAVDVYRAEHGWLVKVELAGVRAEDIQVRTAGRTLFVEGQRRDSVIREGHRSYSMEITYSRFERSIELPCDLEGARIDREYRDGMLLVHLSTEAT